VRDKLEKAIAAYSASNMRPLVSVKTGKASILPDGSLGLPSISDGPLVLLEQLFAPERFGFEKLDAINYYTNKLIELNKAVSKCI
jgi:hypothetical protein